MLSKDQKDVTKKLKNRNKKGNKLEFLVLTHKVIKKIRNFFLLFNSDRMFAEPYQDTPSGKMYLHPKCQCLLPTQDQSVQTLPPRQYLLKNQESGSTILTFLLIIFFTSSWKPMLATSPLNIP